MFERHEKIEAIGAGDFQEPAMHAVARHAVPMVNTPKLLKCLKTKSGTGT
jgi:hypothetical protein